MELGNMDWGIDLSEMDFALCEGLHVTIKGGRSFDVREADGMRLLDVLGSCMCMTEWLMHDYDGEDYEVSCINVCVNSNLHVNFSLSFTGKSRRLQDDVWDRLSAALLVKKLGLL